MGAWVGGWGGGLLVLPRENQSSPVTGISSQSWSEQPRRGRGVEAQFGPLAYMSMKISSRSRLSIAATSIIITVVFINVVDILR